MRRKDKEITDPRKIKAVLKKAQIIHLGLLEGDRPYVVPLNFGYAENTIYFHCAMEGKKIDLINCNNTVCFQTEIDVRVLNADQAPDCTTYYKSVIGYGKAYIIENAREKKLAADILMDHYLGDEEKGRKHQYGKCMKDVCMVKIEIDSISGKQTLPELVKVFSSQAADQYSALREVRIGQRDRHVFHLTLKGKTIQASYDHDDGINAVVDAAKLVTALDQIPRKALGVNEPPTFVIGRSVNDASHLTVYGGIPTLLYGPQGGNTCKANEYLEVDSLVPTARIYLNTALNILT